MRLQPHGGRRRAGGWFGWMGGWFGLVVGWVPFWMGFGLLACLFGGCSSFMVISGGFGWVGWAVLCCQKWIYNNVCSGDLQ